MTSATELEVAGLWVVSPEYMAVRVWVPGEKALVEKVAVLPLRGTLPRLAVPLKKVTLPDRPVTDEVTVAVSMMMLP